MKHFGICLILLWTMPLLSAGIPSSRSELRIVLLGKSGAGKSTTGNTILRKKIFKEDSTFDSVTTVSHNESGTVFGRQIAVVDTPGLFDTSKTPDELKSEIEKCVNLSVPGPHVFLLVIRLGVRFTQEERNAVKWIQENFGKRAAEFTMVLFTHATQGKSVEHNFNTDIRNIIDSCGGGYHSFHNLERDDQTQVEELLEKIDAMLEKNGGEYYTSKLYQEAQRKMREEERKRQEEEKKQKEHERKIREDERKQSEEDFRKAEEERKRDRSFAKKVGEGVEAAVEVVEATMSKANDVVVAAVESMAGTPFGKLMVAGLEIFGHIVKDKYSSSCRCSSYMTATHCPREKGKKKKEKNNS